MHHVKIPVYIAKTASGLCAAQSLGAIRATSVQPDSTRCLDELKRFILWRLAEDGAEWMTNYGDVQLREMRVAIRPANEFARQSFPLENRFELSVPYVLATRDDDAATCFLPEIGESFPVRDPNRIGELIADKMQAELNNVAPRELIQMLTATNREVQQLVVKVPRERRTELRMELPTLKAIATPLAMREVRRSYAQAFERDSEINAVAELLAEPRGNILLLGDAGVGKTTILVQAIRALERQQSAEHERNHRAAEAENRNEATRVPIADRFWLTSADRLIAGMQYLGQWEARAEEAIAELASVQGVLCATDLEPLIRMGGKDATDSLATFLMPYLANSELRMVVEASRSELDACRRLLPGFEGLFRIVEIKGFSRESAKSVLLKCGQGYKQNLGIDFDLQSAELAYRLFRRFLPYDTFPGKCVQFWKTLFEQASLDKHAAKRPVPAPAAEPNSRTPASATSTNRADDPASPAPPRIDTERVVMGFIEQTGLPEVLIRDQQLLNLEQLSRYFEQRVVGQTAACRSVTHLVTT